MSLDRITIDLPGHRPIETTTAKLRQAAAVMELETATKGRGRMGEASSMMPGASAENVVKIARAGAARRRAAKGENTDLEEFTGTAPEQEEREAEAGGIAADRLRSIIERIERLEEERAALAGNVKDIFQEAKSASFDVKVIRQILATRKKDPKEVEEQETLYDLYKRALGM